MVIVVGVRGFPSSSIAKEGKIKKDPRKRKWTAVFLNAFYSKLYGLSYKLKIALFEKAIILIKLFLSKKVKLSLTLESFLASILKTSFQDDGLL